MDLSPWDYWEAGGAKPKGRAAELLAALEPSPFPVISLYLSLSTNPNGREDYQQFVRKVFSERARALPEQSPERESFDKDVKRIQDYLDKKGAAAGQAVAIFASSGSELFELFRSKRRSRSTRCSSARSLTSIRWPGS